MNENSMEANSLIPVAAYIRMSTERQKYSLSNQLDTIQSYANENNMEIVATFSDSGKSGLSLKGRAGLSGLLSIVRSGQATFCNILVFDVSRWGRFQDTDEAAFYEYQCKLNNIQVHYCVENFVNDGSTVGTIVKSLKRAMAAEFSRELSSKVFIGQCNLVRKGFRQGGVAGFGLRRMLVNESGRFKGILEYGEHKSIRTDRVILVPGPEEEVSVVRRIYQIFASSNKTYIDIARTLNEEGVKPDLGITWSRRKIKLILTNEKYIGNNLYNRTSQKLLTKSIENPPEIWVRADGAFESIIPIKLFKKVQLRVKSFKCAIPEKVLLAKLKKLYKKHGYLTSALISKSKQLPHTTTYEKRFGSITNAYKLIGYTPKRNVVPDEILLSNLKKLYEKKGTLNEAIINSSNKVPSPRTLRTRFGSMYEAYRLIGFNNERVLKK